MKAAQLDYRQLCAVQVNWYRSNGKHQNRIRRDRDGVEYVIGDWSWNRSGDNPHEFIEYAMNQLQ